MEQTIHKMASISDDGLYRYWLRRVWDWSIPMLSWIMLNPSTADAELDDPTIRRCMGFARSFGFGGIRVLNLYAYRATNPKVMKQASDPVGPDNDHHLSEVMSSSQWWGTPVIAAWGANAEPSRVDQVLTMPGAEEVLYSLGTTKAGAPKHPLYLPGASQMQRWPLSLLSS